MNTPIEGNGTESGQETTVVRYSDGKFEELSIDPREICDPSSSAWITVVDAAPSVDGQCVIHMQAPRREMFVICNRADLVAALTPLSLCFQIAADVCGVK